MYRIELSGLAQEGLAGLRAFDRAAVVGAMVGQLTYEPTAPTRNRKLLPGAAASFEFEPPLWELRAGEYRVFYDVDEEGRVVRVRAIRRKPPHKTTEEVL